MEAPTRLEMLNKRPIIGTDNEVRDVRKRTKARRGDEERGRTRLKDGRCEAEHVVVDPVLLHEDGDLKRCHLLGDKVLRKREH